MSRTPDRSERTPVLFVNTPTMPPIGADTWIHAQIIRALDRGRFDVHVACTPGPAGARTPMYEAIADAPDLQLVPVDFGRERSHRSGLRRIVEVLADLRSIVSFVKLAFYVRRRRIPIIHTVTRPRDALACVLLAKLTGAKCLIHMQLAYGEWMGRSLRWALRNADGLVAISDFVAGTLIASGHLPERIHLASNAVVLADWERVDDRRPIHAELGLPPSAPVVVTVSRLFREKGTAELLRAIAVVRDELPGVKLVIVGRDVAGGAYLQELESIVEAEDLHESVVFLGQRADIPRIMGAADVFAMPSFEEPFGIVFAEAMAMELPVIALDDGGTPEVVDHARAGLLSKHGDIEALAANLLTLLRDPALRDRMGAYGRRQVSERFTVEHLATEMAGIYDALAR